MVDIVEETVEEAVDIVEETVEEAEVDATVEVVAVDATVEEVEEAAIKYDIFTYDMYMCTIACSNEIKDYTGVTCNLGGWHPYTVNYFSDI